MARVLTVGIAVLDYVFAIDVMPSRPEKHFVDRLAVVGGGMAANAAVAACRLGGEAILVTRLGDDLAAGEIVTGLEREGVDCRFVRRVPGCTSSISAVVVDAKGDRMIVNHQDRSFPALPDWLPDRLPDGVGAAMADTRWEEGGLAILTLAREAGAVAMIDVDLAPKSQAFLDTATHLAFSAEAARQITGIGDVADAAAALAARNSQWLSVTDGPRGCWYRDGGTIRHAPAFPVEAVDTLAAGDTWHGAFLLALAEGRPVEDGIRFAQAAAALKCTRFGGRAGMPTRAEVDAFLKDRTP